MIDLIVVLVFSLLVGYFATQNTASVALHLGPTVLPAVPVFVVVLLSMLLGLLLAGIIHMTHRVSSTLALRRKEKTIRDEEKQIEELRHEMKELKAENKRLRERDDTPPLQEDLPRDRDTET